MIATAILTVLADGLFVAYWARYPLVTVEAEITLGAQQISSTVKLQQLPVYDRLQDRWMIGDQEIKDIRTHLIDPDPQRIGPDSVGLFLPLRLSDGGGLETLRQAVSRLAAAGVCQIALFDAPNREESIAAVLRVQRYRNYFGLWKTCKDAFNPPPFRLD